MDALPIELHSHILFLGSLDDSKTQRSISRVSRYFHGLVKPYEFFNISLSCPTPESLESLSARLSALPAHQRHIYKLFVSDRKSRDGSSKTAAYTGSVTDMSKPEVFAPLMQIMTLAAPTLRKLTFAPTFYTSSSSLIASVLLLQYPRLLNLTIFGNYSLPFPTSQNSHDEDYTPLFPMLEQLSLYGNNNPRGLFAAGSLSSIFPSLAQIHVGGVSGAVTWALEVEEAIEALDSPSSQDLALVPTDEREFTPPSPTMSTYSSSWMSPTPLRLPACLNTLVIEPGVAPPLTTGQIKHEEMFRILNGARQHSSFLNFAIDYRPKSDLDINKVVERVKMQWAGS